MSTSILGSAALCWLQWYKPLSSSSSPCKRFLRPVGGERRAFCRNRVETSSLNSMMAQIMLAPCNRSLSSCLLRVFRVTCKDMSHCIKQPLSFSRPCSCCRLGKGDQRTGHIRSQKRATIIVAWVTAAPPILGMGWANQTVIGVNTVRLEILLCSHCFYSTMRKSDVLLLVVSLERTVLVRGARWRGGSRPASPTS